MKNLLFAGAFACSLAFAGCTSDQQAQAAAAIQVACVAGATTGIQVSGAGVAFTPIVQAVAPGACAGIIALAQAEVNQIVASGGTAVVAVTTTPPASSKGKRTVRKLVITPTSVTTYAVVGPNLVPGF